MISRLLFVLIVVVTTPCFSQNPGEDVNGNGVLIVKADELSAQPVPLNGYWSFYPNQLLDPAEINRQTATSFIQVPSWWSESDKPGVQAATYRLKVILPQGTSDLAISMPEVYCSYMLWVNGKHTGANGVVGLTKTESKPQWKPETYELPSGGDTLDIVLQISNFYHYRTGINIPILIGKAEHLAQRQGTIEISNFLLLSGLAILSITALIMYFMRSQNMALLFYLLLCMSWMIRVAFSNHYQIVQWFPDINWYLCVRTEYISIYLATLFGSLLVGSLFPQDINNAFRLFFVITSACFTLFSLIAPPALFTSFVQLYVGLSTLLLISILVIVVKAYLGSRNGAGLIMFCVLLGVLIFGYAILCFQGVFELNDLAFNIGFLIQFIIMFVAVTQRIHKMNTTSDFQSRMTFDEVTKLK